MEKVPAWLGASETEADLKAFEVNTAEVLAAATLARVEGKIPPARLDAPGTRVGLINIDGQICFTGLQGELLVRGGLTDMYRTALFIVNNVRLLSGIDATLDTHALVHIFYPWFYVDQDGTHPPPFTVMKASDLKSGRWRVNPEMAYLIFGDTNHYTKLVQFTIRYMQALEDAGLPPICTWNAHAELGTPGHAMVPTLYRACVYFHFARWGHFRRHLKGQPALAESLSPFRSQVLLQDDQGNLVGEDRRNLIREIFSRHDVHLLTGEASSHCVAEGGMDVMDVAEDLKRADHVYVLSDCMSPVSGFEALAEKFLSRMRERGARIVKSTDPVSTWGGPIEAAVNARGVA